jgi:hypothetical protein
VALRARKAVTSRVPPVAPTHLPDRPTPSEVSANTRKSKECRPIGQLFRRYRRLFACQATVSDSRTAFAIDAPRAHLRILGGVSRKREQQCE